jgi:pilus assembly protein CpaB
MNRRFLVVLGLAVVFSLLATYAFYSAISRKIANAQRRPAAVLVVAARDLPVGTLVKDADLKTVPWGGPIAQNWLTRADEMVGRGVVSTIYAGEPVIQSRLAAKGAGAGLAAVIPAGMRAVAVRVNEVVGVSGYVVPGMRVDLIGSGTPARSQNTGTLTRTVLQNIEVLSAGQNMEHDAQGKPVTVDVVNLLVTPDQAEILSLASMELKIQLVLRNPLDTNVAKTAGTGTNQLFSMAAPAPVRTVARPAPKPAPAPPVAAPPPPAPRPTIEVIHGNKRTEVPIAFAEPLETTK